MLIIIISCNENITTPGEEKHSIEKYSKIFDVKNIENSKCDQIAITDALEEAALALSKAIKNKEMRLKIKEEVGKKFDGDFDVLYKTIKDHQLSGNSFNKVFASGYKESKRVEGKNLSDEQAETDLSQLINKIPKFQIAIPVNFDKWNAEKDIPLVAFRPMIKDSILKQIKAIDEKGNIHWMDARKKPDIPIIVVSWNERTDDNGNLHSNMIKDHNTVGNNIIPGFEKSYKNKSSNAHTLYNYSRLTVDTFEVCSNNGTWYNWAEGDPEFYINSRHGRWDKGNVEFEDCTIEGKYGVGRPLFSIAATVPGTSTYIQVREWDAWFEEGDDIVETYWATFGGSQYYDWNYYTNFYTLAETWAYGSNGNVNLYMHWVLF